MGTAITDRTQGWNAEAVIDTRGLLSPVLHIVLGFSCRLWEVPARSDRSSGQQCLADRNVVDMRCWSVNAAVPRPLSVFL